jgi:Spx/MgsR family transcriptional regulator
MTTLYGIPGCDTVKKARRWLDAHAVAYHFHDLRRDGLDETLLATWIARLGWETLLNRRGTTWRRLPAATRAAIDRDSATRLMLEQPAIIRRPVLSRGSRLQVGFSADEYATLFGTAETA